MTNQQRNNLAILMYLLISLGGIVVDIVVPSLPSIRTEFSASETVTQWSFTAAMLGFGLGQLVAGFIVDAYGRKTPMLIGVFLLVTALLLSIISPNIYSLIVLRLLEGLAVSFVCVGGRAVIKDMYHGAEYLKAVNWITISFAMGITLSPFVGGHLESMFGWQSIFIALAIWVALGGVFLWLFFSETMQVAQPLRGEQIRSNLTEIVLNRNFQRTAIICGVFYSILPAFNTVGPFIIQSRLGYSPVFYGNIALALGACWLLGNLANRFLFSISAERKTNVAITASLAALMIGMSFQYIYGLNLLAFLLPVAVIIVSLGMLFPLYLGKALLPFPHIAGVANAIVFSGSWLCTALISFVASTLPVGSAFPLLGLYFVLLVLVVVIKNSRNV
ncbi:MFS transporter [Vibrio barjaei]|uniref:MFS transporter n=1 Tax=Vibrio barjaei TaxID=1676683 RepID=A0ABW7IQH6_9VIBR